MHQRGRKSSAQLAVLPMVGGQRPNPPSNLSKAQAAVWKAVAATKPADWFNHDTFPLLAQYCRHIESADQIAAQINAIDPADLADKVALSHYDLLLKLRERESASLIKLAAAMRLSQAARMRGDRSAGNGNVTNQSVEKPWQTD